MEVAQDLGVDEERGVVTLRQPLHRDPLDRQAIAIGGGELDGPVPENEVHPGKGEPGGLRGPQGSERCLGNRAQQGLEWQPAEGVPFGFGKLGELLGR